MQTSPLSKQSFVSSLSRSNSQHNRKNSRNQVKQQGCSDDKDQQTPASMNYQYGNSIKKHTNSVSSQKNSFKNKSIIKQKQSVQIGSPTQTKVLPLSRESIATATDLEAELSDLASIIRKEREQVAMSLRNSSYTGVSQMSAFNSLGGQENFEQPLNLRQSEGQSIIGGLDSSRNAGSLLVQYKSTDQSVVGANILRIDPETLSKQVTHLRNEVEEFSVFQSEAVQAQRRMKQENEDLNVKLLLSEKALQDCQRIVEEQQFKLNEVQNVVEGRNKLLDNIGFLEQRIKIESEQNLNLSSALLKQEAKTAACESALHQQNQLIIKKEQEYQNVLTILDSLKKDYGALLIMVQQLTSMNQSLNDEISKTKQEFNSIMAKSLTLEEENNLLRDQISKIQNECVKMRVEKERFEVSNAKMKYQNENTDKYEIKNNNHNNSHAISKQLESQTIKIDLQAKTIGNLEKQNQQLYEELEKEKKRKESSNNQLESLKSQLVSFQAEMEQLKESNYSLKFQNSSLSAQKNGLQSQILSSDKQELVLSSCQENEQMKLDLKNQKEKGFILEQQCLILSKNATSLSDKVIELRKKNKELEKRLLEQTSLLESNKQTNFSSSHYITTQKGTLEAIQATHSHPTYSMNSGKSTEMKNFFSSLAPQRSEVTTPFNQEDILRQTKKTISFSPQSQYRQGDIRRLQGQEYYDYSLAGKQVENYYNHWPEELNSHDLDSKNKGESFLLSQK